MRSTFKVLFYLKKDKHKVQPVVPVMGRITVNGTIAQFSAKLSVPPHLWEVKGGRAKGKSLEADRINRYLDNIRIQIGKHYQSICDRDGYVSADKVKNAYLGFSKRYKLLLELCDEFCKEYKNRIDVDRTIHSLFRYQTLRRDLSLFICQDYKVKDIPLVELDQSFAEKFAAYLKHVKGLANTTISVEIKSLKHIVKKAFNDGQMEKNPFAYYYYFADQPEIEYLTEEEINKLIIGKVKQQRQDRTRDMFLFCCFTGLSYADLAKLSYEELKQTPNGAWWISSIRQKTKVPFTVKLLPVAKAILEKYKDQLPSGMILPIISNQKVNEYLKEIASICSINKSLTFHVARHTCVSKGTIKSLRSKLSQIDLRIPTNHPTQKHIQFLLRTFGRNFKKCT